MKVKCLKLAKKLLWKSLSINISSKYWEQKFLNEQTSWGKEAADSAILAKDIFIKNKFKDILIPGIGYGRNAKVFMENGMNVTGIEISQSAIDLARTENKLDIRIHHGSVTEMPFDNHIYDGIFCYALIHLLSKPQRVKFIRNCYEQLKKGGYMIFTVISNKSSLFGNGKYLSKNRYKIANGLDVFFYSKDSITKEFSAYGLLDFEAIDEPIKHMKDEPPLKCFTVFCQRL